MQFPSQCKNSTDRYGSTIYTVFCSAVLCKQQKSSKLWGSFLPWCRVCTIVKFILKGSYRCGEPKNVISQSVQIPHRPVRVNKLSHVLQRFLSPWQRVCTNAVFIFKETTGLESSKLQFPSYCKNRTDRFGSPYFPVTCTTVSRQQ